MYTFSPSLREDEIFDFFWNLQIKNIYYILLQSTSHLRTWFYDPNRQMEDELKHY